MNSSTTHPPHEIEELDLAIPNLHTADDEIAASKILHQLHGIEAVRIIERGIWISFRPKTIHHDAICDALRGGGFRATVFQDSETGETGSTSV